MYVSLISHVCMYFNVLQCLCVEESVAVDMLL